MAKPRDPHADAWANIKAEAESRYGKGWGYMSPDQKRGAYCSVFMTQAAGFARMNIDSQVFVALLVYVNSQIVDEVVALGG